MQSFKSVHLYLDCDATGQKCSQKAITIDHAKFVDYAYGTISKTGHKHQTIIPISLAR